MIENCPYCRDGLRYMGLVDDEDRYEKCAACDGEGKVETVRIANFSHPLSGTVLDSVLHALVKERLEWRSRGVLGDYSTAVKVEEVRIPCQIDLEKDVLSQVYDLWKQIPVGTTLMAPPALGVAAHILGALTAFGEAVPPSPMRVIWLIREEGSLPPRFVLGGITR